MKLPLVLDEEGEPIGYVLDVDGRFVERVLTLTYAPGKLMPLRIEGMEPGDQLWLWRLHELGIGFGQEWIESLRLNGRRTLGGDLDPARKGAHDPDDRHQAR